MKYFVAYSTAAAIIILPLIYSEKSEINVVLKHSAYFKNAKYVEKMSSTRKPINRTTSIASLDIYFRPGVVLDSALYIEFIANKKFATQYKQYMVQIKAELCEGLKIKNHPLYQLAFDSTNRSESNMLDPCPIMGHRFIKPYYTSYGKLPPLIPTGIWRIDIKVTKESGKIVEEVFRLHDYYEITAKGIIEF